MSTRRNTVEVLPAGMKAWRAERKMTQAELARKAGVSEGFIALLETGRRQPNLQNAIEIAKALGVPLSAFAILHVDLDALSAAAGAA